jgi:lysophospholipase L1-like esterase
MPSRGHMLLTPTKKLIINICVALVSSSVSLSIGYYVYFYMIKPPKQVIYKPSDNEYLLSFYNRKGERIGEAGGLLKLITDPFTIYMNYPNQKSYRYSINKYGFREGYESKKPHTAIVVGSSAAFGFALDSNEKTFASKVSRYSEKYNVINSAVVGFLSGQELSQMIHYLDDFNPSVYIVFDGWNDIFDPYAFVKNWPVRNAPIGYNNAFFLVENRLAEYFKINQKEQVSQIEALEPVGDPLSEDALFQKVLEIYVANIDKMHAFARARGAKFLLIFQPELGNKKVRSSGEQNTLTTWIDKYGYLDKKISERYNKFITEAKRVFQKKKITFIDINDEPEFSENPQMVFFDVVHPNELGHELIARIIHRALEESF